MMTLASSVSEVSSLLMTIESSFVIVIGLILQATPAYTINLLYVKIDSVSK